MANDRTALSIQLGLDTTEMSGAEMKAIRTKLGKVVGRHIPQDEFSDVVGCRPTGISEYENDHRAIPQAYAHAARLALRVAMMGGLSNE